MFEKKDLKKIEDKIKEFFDKMGFSVDINLSFKDETLSADVKSQDPKVLIGQQGIILLHIQRLLKIILTRRFEQTFYLNLDINDYKKKKTKYLKEMANNIADEVSLTRQEKILPAMPAYERRVVHLELADRKNIATQSAGEEPERKVIIRPYP